MCGNTLKAMGLTPRSTSANHSDWDVASYARWAMAPDTSGHTTRYEAVLGYLRVRQGTAHAEIVRPLERASGAANSGVTARSSQAPFLEARER